MKRVTTVRAVEDKVGEFALEVGLHVEELEPEHPRVDRDRMGTVEAGGDCLVDELVGLRRLLGDAPDCPLEDAAFASDHGGMVRRPKGCRGKGASK